MFHKNGMRPLIIANGTKCYSILYCNSPWRYIRLKYTYSAISVKLDSLPGNSKKWRINLFVAFEVRLVHSWPVCTNEYIYACVCVCVYICTCIYTYIHVYLCVYTNYAPNELRDGQGDHHKGTYI